MMLKIKFKSKIYYLTSGLQDSPIATKRQYCNGLVSYAHLQSNGEVWRYHEKIGDIKDIEIIKEVEDLKLSKKAMGHLFEWMFKDL